MSFRIACTIFLLVSVCAFPVFFTFGVGIFAVVWFRRYYELIPLYLLSDMLHGTALHHFFYFPYVMTLAAVILVALSSLFRTQLFDTGMGKI